MSKKAIIVLVVAAVLLAALAAVFCVEYFVLQVPLFDRGGWSTLKNGSICYRDYYAKPFTGWQSIDGDRYYFSEDGAMHTGWLTWEESRYYFDQSGKLHTGTLEADGQRYYLKEDGTPHTGWLDGAYYDAEGILKTGWLTLPEGTYLLDEEGRPRTGWVGECGRRYYFGQDGIQDTRWQDSDSGLQYIVDGQPHIGWLDVPEGKFYFNEDGYSHAGWVTDEKGRFYLYGDGTYAAGFVTVGDIERYFLPTGEYVLLCNRWNYIPDDFEMNLVEYGKFKLDASCYDDFVAMVDAAKQDSVSIKINNSYRSVKWQEDRWELRRSQHMANGMTLEQADARIGQSLAIPGTSEHHTGLAMDIYGSDKIYKWLADNSWKYGFIVRYPDNKIDITGIIYEPWHLRYVGKTLAKELYDSGLCLEEYLTQLKEN